ncbi:hypothetical protein FOCC_FOCC007792 [Frankliniella occidentalis]|nr:hypothetical protein FOCC_FOCC007792 [Frankliniella occidentalis]
MLAMIDKRLKQATGNYSDIFGGLFVYFFGDIHQLPPVKDTPLYSAKIATDEPLKQHGKFVWDSVEASLFLHQVHRQTDVEFTSLLSRLSKGEVTQDDFEVLQKRFTTSVTYDERQSFKSALCLFPTKDEVALANLNYLTSLKSQADNKPVPVVSINADHNSDTAKSGSSNQAGGLAANLLLAPSCRIMLRSNQWTEQGLVNGAMGHLVDVVFDQPNNPSEAVPKVLMCVFDNYKGPYIGNDINLKLVPIPIITRSWDYNGTSCSRSQFPVQVAFAVTIHKSQGLTLAKVKINIGSQKEMTPGLTFVAVSRAKALNSILLEPFCSKRLLNINTSKVLESKKNFKVELHNKQLFKWYSSLMKPVKMSSPSKPAGAKLRNAKTMIRGQEYKVDFLYQEKSKFPDAITGEIAIKTIAVFKDLETFVFYVYLCKDYDNKEPEFVNQLNSDINEGKNIRVVYYGSIGNYNVTKLLLDGEELNQTTLAGVAAIESNRPGPSN